MLKIIIFQLFQEMAYKSETNPEKRISESSTLTPVEESMFYELVSNSIGENIRLEQERVGFGYVNESSHTPPPNG